MTHAEFLRARAEVSRLDHRAVAATNKRLVKITCKALQGRGRNKGTYSRKVKVRLAYAMYG